MELEFVKYCEKNNLEYHILDKEEEETIRKNIAEKYIDKNKKYEISTSDMLKSEIGTRIGHIDGSWKWIRRYIENKEIVFFFDYKKSRYIKLYDGAMFAQFYYDFTYRHFMAYKKEFYITNENTDFLIIYDHLMNLLTYGEAEKWLKSTILYQYWIEDCKKKS